MRKRKHESVSKRHPTKRVSANPAMCDLGRGFWDRVQPKHIPAILACIRTEAELRHEEHVQARVLAVVLYGMRVAAIVIIVSIVSSASPQLLELILPLLLSRI